MIRDPPENMIKWTRTSSEAVLDRFSLFTTLVAYVSCLLNSCSTRAQTTLYPIRSPEFFNGRSGLSVGLAFGIHDKPLTPVFCSNTDCYHSPFNPVSCFSFALSCSHAFNTRIDIQWMTNANVYCTFSPRCLLGTLINSQTSDDVVFQYWFDQRAGRRDP
jgi:hypothetical protein